MASTWQGIGAPGRRARVGELEATAGAARAPARGGRTGQGQGATATRSGRHGQPGGVEEVVGVVGSNWRGKSKNSPSVAYVAKALVPVHGINRDQCHL